MPEITVEYRRISRKPHWTSHKESITVGLREFEREDARLAFEVGVESFGSVTKTEVYSIEGLLYRPVTSMDSSERLRFDDAEFPKTQGYKYLSIEAPDSEAAAAEVRASVVGRTVLVDGEVFCACLEPQWRVASPMAGAPVVFAEIPTGRLGTLSEMIFRADELDEALAYAASSRRGSEITVVDEITIHDHSEVKLITPLSESREVRNLRVDYRSACSSLARAKTNEEEARAFERVAHLRRKIIGSGAMPMKTSMEAYEDRPGVGEKMGA